MAPRDGDTAHTAVRWDDVLTGHRRAVFFLFSSRLGCLGSLALSALVTVVLLLTFHVL